MFQNKKAVPILLIALLFVGVLLSSTITGGTDSLSAAAQSMVVGGASGSNCSDFAGGFAIGMGIAGLCGCLWCFGVAIAAKVVEAYC